MEAKLSEKVSGRNDVKHNAEPYVQKEEKEILPDRLS